MMNEIQPISVGFSSREVEMIRQCWDLLDSKDSVAQPDQLIGAYKSKLKNRVLDIVWFELTERPETAKADARQRLAQVCENIQHLK